MFGPTVTVDPIRSSYTNLVELGLDIQTYSEENGGYLPSLTNCRSLTQLEYHGDVKKDPFVDHTDNEELLTNPYYSKAKLGAIPVPGNVALAYDCGKSPLGRAVLFADFRVKVIDQAHWEIIKRYSHIK
jgi:hypothetical protein